jgi:hypothetical protein
VILDYRKQDCVSLEVADLPPLGLKPWRHSARTRLRDASTISRMFSLVTGQLPNLGYMYDPK